MRNVDELKKQAAGTVVLTEDSLDANKKAIHAGTQISPDVEGWPAHRVLNHLVQNKAKAGTGAHATAHEHGKGHDPKHSR